MRSKFVLILAIIFLGCSEFLTITPREEVSIDEQFSTLEGTKLALAGAYLKTEELISSSYFLYADLTGGNLTFTPTRTGSNRGIISVPSDIDLLYGFNEIPESPSLSGFYENSYATIANLNNIIQFTPLLNADSKVTNQIVSEALALRAYMHSVLIKLYGQYYEFSPNAAHLGIVYADKILVGGKDYPARKTVNESYDLIIADFNRALSLAKETSALPGPRYSYLLPHSINGLLARVYLESSNYEKAIEHALKSMQLAGIQLASKEKLIDEWARPTDPISEVIFELTPPRDRAGAIVSSSVSAYYKLIRDGSGNALDYARYCASGDLLNLYSTNDIRGSLFIQQPLSILSDTFGLRNFAFTTKHQDNAGTLVMRLSELHLVIAEAYFKTGDNANALKYLNTIRERSGLSPLQNTSNFIEELFNERRRELCFEGHLFFDISRFEKDCIRSQGCLTTKCNLTHPNARFVLPIPRSSIIVNENIKQNEGY